MGKAKLIIGGLLVIGTGIAALLGLKKDEDERYKKIMGMINNVDLKKEEPKKEETAEEIIDDIEKSFRDMGLNDEADAYVEATEAIENLRKKGEAELDKLKSKSVDELFKMQEQFDKEHRYAIIRDGVKIPATREEWEAENKRLAEEAARKREERLENGEWLEDVEKAKKDKNFSKLEDLFDEKYNPYPYHPAPATVYGEAIGDGVIDEKLYNAAAKYFGRLWTYSGD